MHELVTINTDRINARFNYETLYMFRTVFPSIIRSSRLYIQQQVYVKLKLQGWVKLLENVGIGCRRV